MALWSTFYPRLMPRVMGCPAPVADAELRAACREIFEKTRAWRQWLDPFTVVDGVRQYSLVIPAGAEIYRPEAATLDGNPLDVDGAFALSKDPALHTGSGDGLVSQDRESVLLLNATPAGAVVQIKAALVPSNDATGIPDHLASQFADAILAGARFRIRTIPGQVFTDVASAAVDLAKCESEIGRIQADAFRSHTNSTPRRRPTWC